MWLVSIVCNLAEAQERRVRAAEYIVSVMRIVNKHCGENSVW
jgi:hypothetical protein